MSFLRPSPDPTTAIGQLHDWLGAVEPERLVIETSGSTGRPKRVLLSREAVLASVHATAHRLGDAGGPGQGRWALRLPSSYVAGVQVIVRSLVAGHEPVLDGWQAAGEETSYTSLVPTQLHRMLQSPEDVAALRGLRAVLLGGGPIDPALRRRAEDEGIRLVATYGASETAGGCVYDGLPLDGVAVALGAQGRIRIAGPTLFDGYLDDPELTAQTLVDGWYLTADAGRIDEDGRLQVLGRLDDVVVSGGVNVPLPAVARRLTEHEDVEAAEVLGFPDPEWGTRVVAFVSGAVDPDELREWVAAVHPRSWAPRQVVRLAELPLLDNGKVDRQALRRCVEDAS
ncbi:AMP-binding protein [Nocardioides houyundeii]|uniref:AMP-binding protein n=1 Tax=Nocardioides houyundeii TaxID=2045452 RepID=UPI001F076D82|nr:AMP-binding protein [Nocardioides houyundeii]